MKYYDFALAPSPRRVRVFMAEKGIEIPSVQVNLREGEHLKPEFIAINPWATVPVLELDDGTCISEAMAVCRYLEAAYPEPPLMGRTATEIGVIAMWEHRLEWDGYLAVAETLRNSAERMKDRAFTGTENFVQIPEVAERGRLRIQRFFEVLDQRCSECEFVAGETYSVADITALISVDFAAGGLKIAIPDDLTHARRWHEAVSSRPSAKA